MHQDQNLTFAIEYSNQTAIKYWNKLPVEDRTVLGVQDLAQDLLIHFLSKINAVAQSGANKGMPLYDKNRDFKKWCRTVIFNKAITITTTIWDKKITSKQNRLIQENGLVTVYSKDLQNNPELIFATEITPETLLIQIEQENEAMAGTNITITEVQELCDRFSIEFTPEDVMGSLCTVVSYAAGDISQDEFDALPDELQGKIATLVTAINEDDISITTKKVGKLPKVKTQKQEKELKTGKKKAETTPGPGKGVGRSNPDGPVAKIREAFKEGNGIVTLPEMLVHIKKLNIVCSEATIRTQVGRLRRAYNLAGESQRGAKPKSGVVNEIKAQFADGKQTIAEVIAVLTEKGLTFSPSTVRTQVGILRKAAGLVSDHRLAKTSIPADMAAQIEASVEEVSIG
jgi:hypothetical protein